MYMCVMEYFSAIKKEVNPAIMKTWMDLEDILLSELWVFSSCGRHVGYILELRRGCPF